jgi:SPP1 gp7 family putative phage head morphogenesis protein
LYFQGSYVKLAKAFRAFLLDESIGLEYRLPRDTGLERPFYPPTPEEISRRFVIWLDAKFEEIFDYEDGDLEDLLTEVYIKGAKRSYALAKPKSIVPSAAFAAGAAAEFIRSLTTAPESKGNLGLIKYNATNQYRLINTQLKQQISRIVSEELISGLKPKPTALKIGAAIDKTNKTRAKLLARTETTRAHAEGQLDAFTALGLKNVGVRAEWSAAADACPKCAPFDGQIFTVAEAHGLIPLHPNCRCLWLPVEDSPK